ncbi:MAG: VCBS repeat-containing protein [Lewinellaceae bacterium]|nr:VCBS repeat-containing protein [Lewinellaceae bacterium]
MSRAGVGRFCFSGCRVRRPSRIGQVLFSLLLFAGLSGCSKDKTLFRLLDSKKTGIDFNNSITESAEINILNSEFIYNGGGVAVGDLNGDGLADLYFTGNQVDNKLYLNRGNLHFEDVTQKAHAQKKPGQWSSGINILDINRDGKADIYVCNTFQTDPESRKNLLFVNQGNDPQGIPQFNEMAAAYGIADTTHSSNAQFFDFDNDGDLDLFIATNFMDRRNPNKFDHKIKDGSAVNRDRLYRNDMDVAKGHPVFTEITREAGLIWEGYSHSALVADFNEDGWPDIYVANDYVSNDLIYINNRNGTFSNQIARIFKHQSASAMGSDVADINNDGRPDLFTTEMLPYYNKRKKLFLGPNNYAVYANNEEYGFEYQYPRNTLQLNRGIDPETGLPAFSEIAFLAGVQESEWSWTPLLADFDNDGYRDLFITNGFPRDVTDHDFSTYLRQYSHLVDPMELQDMIPKIKVPKFIFKNDGNLHFSDYSKKWGVDASAFSNGAAYGDLDNDGDLDLVVNNINDNAFVFQNTLNDEQKNNHFIRLRLNAGDQNPDAFGIRATVYWDGKKQAVTQMSARGYISTSENIVHCGLGATTKVDSVVVRWNDRQTTVLVNPAVDQTITVHFEGQAQRFSGPENYPGWFVALDSTRLGVQYVHHERDFVDFDLQRTLPHKFSQSGPAMAVGDANGDGLDDVYFSGSDSRDGTWLIQTAQGKFAQKAVNYKTNPEKRGEELGVLLFDADNDGDNDLYLVHGSYEYNPGSPFYQDVLCVNDGKGNFSPAPQALPQEFSSGQCVKAADFDGDGDLDLFVGGRVLPFAYPKPDRSFILRNDSKEPGKPLFTNVTREVCPELEYAGMISDALWTDFNNDNRPDLLLAGEWMPLTFFQNLGGTFKNITATTGISDKLNWWTSLAGADFDNDGDIDYAAGGNGQNLYFRGTAEEPLRVYAKDFDKNNSMDPFISCYWLDSLGRKKEYFYHTRDDMVKQLVQIRRKFLTYGALGEATVQEVFSPEELKDAIIRTTNWQFTSYVENLGNGQFRISPFPVQAQVAPVFGMLPYDIDHDGLTDLLLVGNDYGMELLQGRADAFYGLVLKNKGNNQFDALELPESRFCVPRDAKALTRVGLATGQEIILATQNRDVLKAFVPRIPAGSSIALKTNEVKAYITLAGGRRQLREFYPGSGYLSQEPSSIRWNSAMLEIEFFDRQNRVTRKLSAPAPSLR